VTPKQIAPNSTMENTLESLTVGQSSDMANLLKTGNIDEATQLANAVLDAIDSNDQQTSNETLSSTTQEKVSYFLFRICQASPVFPVFVVKSPCPNIKCITSNSWLTTYQININCKIRRKLGHIFEHCNPTNHSRSQNIQGPATIIRF